jgi:hypothetical protein
MPLEKRGSYRRRVIRRLTPADGIKRCLHRAERFLNLTQRSCINERSHGAWLRDAARAPARRASGPRGR